MAGRDALEGCSPLRVREVLRRLRNRSQVRAWEGGEAFLADLDGRPCFVIDEGTMADFLDEEDRGMKLGRVFQFDTAEARDAHVQEWLRPWLRREREDALIRALGEGRITKAEFAAALETEPASQVQ